MGEVSYGNRRLGVGPAVFAGPVPNRTRWTEQRIDAKLRTFCAGRPAWPTYGDFERAGANGLYLAAARQGGITVWRWRLGYG